MSERVILAHEIDEEQGITILARGKLGLTALEAIERFCHRQRVNLCRELQQELQERNEPKLPFACVATVICASCEVKDRPGARHLNNCPAAPGELIRPVTVSGAE